MDIKEEITCPLGSQCTEIKNNKLYRCAWHTKIIGRNPQTDQDVDEWGCAMAWIPILLVENAMTNRGQTAALESFRNEVVSGTEQTNNILIASALGQIPQQLQITTSYDAN